MKGGAQPPVVCIDSPYPSELERIVEGADGASVLVRPIRPSDGPRLQAFHAALSARTRYLRFFNVHPELSSQEVEHFTCVDYSDRLALVVQRGDDLVAIGRYERLPGTSEAEVAFVVADELQHHGLGTLLFDQLVAAARQRGITTFVATTLAENRSMLDVFHHAGFQVNSERDRESVFVRFSIRQDESSRAALEGRAMLGELASPLEEPPC